MGTFTTVPSDTYFSDRELRFETKNIIIIHFYLNNKRNV